MTVTAANIGEYYKLIGAHKARIVAKREALELLERFRTKGILSDKQFEAEAAPIRAELEKLEAETFE